MGERRLDPTTGEWVTFATTRQDRTFQPDPEACPLCPTRPGGPVTEIPRPSFEVAVFDNRFPSLTFDPPAPTVAGSGLLQVQPAYGHCEVVVYTDDHHATLATVGRQRVRLLVDVWTQRTVELGGREGISYVMPFENKGDVVGVTLAHPHGQIYAYPEVPPRPARELETAAAYHRRHGRCVWCDVVGEERHGPRVVVRGEHWIAAVPFWARWPYQTELWPTRHVPDLPDLSSDERDDLGTVLAGVLGAYDALFGFSMPYLLAVHQRPTDGVPRPVNHLHIELNPPYRSAERLKYLAGSETGAGAYLTDVAPETAAARLRQALCRATIPP